MNKRYQQATLPPVNAQEPAKPLPRETKPDPASTIGELSMAFQELENALILLFARLTDPVHDTVGVIIASRLSFRNLVDILDAVFRYRTQDQDLTSRLDSLLGEGRNLEQHRNTYIHSFYDWREISGDQITYERIKNKIKIGKGFSPDYELLDTVKLGEIVDRFRTLIVDIDLFCELLQEQGVIADRRSFED